MWQKIKTFLNTNSFYPDIKRVYYVIIVEGKANRLENFAEYVGAPVRWCSLK